MAIKPDFILNLRGKSYPLYAGILDAATEAGLMRLTTQIVQIPAADNGWMAVVRARAEFEDGRVFEDVGDCSPANTSAQIATAALRMASTRAKGRCLRDAINVGQTMFEELPDEKATGRLGDVDAVPQPGGERMSPAPAAREQRARGSSAPLGLPTVSSGATTGQVVVTTVQQTLNGSHCEVCLAELDEKEIAGCKKHPDWFDGKMLCRQHAFEYRTMAERSTVPQGQIAA